MLQRSNFTRIIAEFSEFSCERGCPMLSWMQRSPYARSIAQGPYHLLRPFPEKRVRRLASGKEELPGDFPDYCVFVTRHSLLAFTTSLTDVSSEFHAFFAKVNYCFAVDRMMRSFLAWGMPGTASLPLGTLPPWFQTVAPPPRKPEPYFAAQRLLPLSSSAGPRQIQVTPQDAGQTLGAAYAAMMEFSAACLNVAPAAMGAWRASAAA
jgi:hypothetical protein